MSDKALAQGVVGILAALAEADGGVADAEAAWWLNVRRKNPLISRNPHDELEDMLRATRATLAETTPQAALAAWAADIPADHAEAVYALALDLQLADGRSTREEKAITVALARALDLSPERASAVFARVLHERGVDF